MHINPVVYVRVGDTPQETERQASKVRGRKGCGGSDGRFQW